MSFFGRPHFFVYTPHELFNCPLIDHVPQKMLKIYIFNPDTDYALAKGTPYYTPPKSIARLSREMELFPTRFADSGDIVIPYSDIRNLCMHLGDEDNLNDYQICPWGWNAVIRRELMEAGVPESMLPTDEDIDRLRHLSHRRTTIKANRILNDILTKYGIDLDNISPLPKEFTDETALMQFLKSAPGYAFLKAPWSSSGRGILFTGDCTEEQIRQWCHGIIRRQGSVMYENAADKSLDFATEWHISRGEAYYLGLSLFETSGRGKYHGNSILSQAGIEEKIANNAPLFDIRWIKAQHYMLKQIVGEHYEGPLGIDMLATKEGNIRGCIEINFRMTMGHAALLTSDKNERAK